MISSHSQRKWLDVAAVGLAVCLVSLVTARPAAAQAPPTGGDTAQAPAAGGGDTGQAAAAPAPDPDKVTLGFFRGTEIGGLVDTYYDFYSTKRDGLFRNFDVKHNSFSISMAEVWLNKAPTKDSPIGYKVKLNFGSATSNLITPATDSEFRNIEEAYGSYMAPVGKGLQIDVGKFVTPAGAEVIEAKDDWNYSRSLLFALAIPYYHAGVRLTYSPNDQVTLMGGVVNGWNNVNDNNTGKTVLASITFKPTAAWNIVENYIGGPEQPNDNTDWRTLSDTMVMYTVNPAVTLMANYDYGHDTVAGVVNTWQGVAGYVKYQANKWIAVVPRYEFFTDPQGWATGVLPTGGTPHHLQEATLTLELKAADNFLWRIEYRGDYSNKSVFFPDTGVPTQNQHSFVLGFLYSFSSKS